jgi:RHS repeat-associated protein
MQVRQRRCSHPGCRRPAGTSYTYEIPNQQGTGVLTINSTAQSPQWRQYTPYGAPRGTAPASWPNTNGFLGKATDPTTGLTIVGARQYDPTTGLFLSIDPILETTNPQQLNGYSYAASNPISQSDPSGLMPAYATSQGTCTGTGAYCSGAIQRHQVAQQQEYNHLTAVIENQQLQNCGGCHPATMRAIAGEYRNPTVVRQRVLSYTATAAHEQNMSQQARMEQEQLELAQSYSGFDPATDIRHGLVAADNFLYNHIYIQISACLLGCAAVSIQGGYGFLTLEFPAVAPVSRSASGFVGFTLGFNSATPAEVNKNNVILEAARRPRTALV